MELTIPVSGGTTVLYVDIKPNFKTDTKLAYKWVKCSDGNYNAVDRGADSDIYDAEVEIYGTESVVDNVINVLNENRTGEYNYLYMASFNSGEKIFGCNVDYTSSITAIVLSVSKKVQRTWKGFSTLVKFRASSPTFTGVGTLPTFKNLEYGYIGDTTTTIVKLDSYTNIYEFQDRQNDSGIFEGVFVLSNSDMEDLRNYIRVQRGNTISITSVSGVGQMFGEKRGSYPYNVKIVEWQDMGQIGINFYRIKLKFAEVI